LGGVSDQKIALRDVGRPTACNKPAQGKGA
jgi:hypothetical protein